MLDWARCLVVDILCAWRSPLIKWMEAPAGTLGCLAWRAPWSTEPCCFQVPCCGSLQGSERSSGWSGGPRGPITGPRPRWARACYSPGGLGWPVLCCSAVLCPGVSSILLWLGRAGSAAGSSPRGQRTRWCISVRLQLTLSVAPPQWLQWLPPRPPSCPPAN